MSVWDWIYDYQQKATRDNDQQRQTLSTMYRRALSIQETNPAQALEILHQGHALAKELQEAWWIMFYEHWQLQTTLFFLLDYAAGLDLAVKAAVEVRKPLYEDFPQRVCIHEDLIGAYIGIDPIGYSDAILESIAYMATQVSPTIECRYCLQGLRCDFAEVCHKWDELQQETTAYLSLADEDDDIYYRVQALAQMCVVLYFRGAWQQLLDVASALLEGAQKRDMPLHYTDALAWQALAMRQLGTDAEAKQLYIRSIQLTSRRQSIPSLSFFRAMTAYHELKGEYDVALAVQQSALNAYKGKHPMNEVETTLHLCQLRARLNILSAEDIAQVKNMLSTLIQPSTYLAKLARIEQGDFSDKF